MNYLQKTISWVFFMMFICLNVMAQNKPDDIVGIWNTEDKDGKIKIYKEHNKYYGKLVWYKNDPDVPEYDVKNPDPELRKRKKIGMVLLSDFVFDKDQWGDGKIYDPQTGKTYSCIIKLNDNKTLFVRGYIGISLIGRTTEWTRSE